jgi:hypothetical protein
LDVKATVLDIPKADKVIVAVPADTRVIVASHVPAAPVRHPATVATLSLDDVPLT